MRRRTPRARLMSILDWQRGQFEFTGCEVVGTDELGIGTSQILSVVKSKIKATVHISKTVLICAQKEVVMTMPL
jgi:hypothetical protein